MKAPGASGSESHLFFLLTGEATEAPENNDGLTGGLDRFTLVEARVGLNHPGGRRHSPAALVVEEENEEELLPGLVLHLLSDAEHVHGGGGDGHPVVLAANARHVGVYDLLVAGEKAGGGGGSHTAEIPSCFCSCM